MARDRSRRRVPLLGAALGAASSSIGVAQRGLDLAGGLVDELRENAGETARTLTGTALAALDAADVGIGDARLTSEGADWARRQVARGLRQLLALPDDATERLRYADPATMARTVIALLGGEEELLPLPSVEAQVRNRFRALLDPTTDGGQSNGALLSITAQLSPDEARILRHLDATGPGPVIDLEATTFGSRGSEIVAENLSVLVERAGGDVPDRGPAYVTNLTRLGLCRSERRELRGHPDYELIATDQYYQEVVERAEQERGVRVRARHGQLRLTALGEQLVSIAFHADATPTPLLDGPPPPPAAALEGAPVRLRGRSREPRR